MWPFKKKPKYLRIGVLNQQWTFSDSFRKDYQRKMQIIVGEVRQHGKYSNIRVISVTGGDWDENNMVKGIISPLIDSDTIEWLPNETV